MNMEIFDEKSINILSESPRRKMSTHSNSIEAGFCTYITVAKNHYFFLGGGVGGVGMCNWSSS